MTANDLELITASAAFAAEAHASQVRKELNEPYIVHPLRVGKMAAMLGQPAFFVAACYLHDVVEDTSIPIVTIHSLFPPETATLVNALTKWWTDGHPSEVVVANKAAYYAQILRTPGAPLLKVLDRVDNLYDFARMARMAPSSHKWAKRYLKKTQEEFGPVLEALRDVTFYGEGMSHDTPGLADRARRFYDVALAGLDAAL